MKLRFMIEKQRYDFKITVCLIKWPSKYFQTNTTIWRNRINKYKIFKIKLFYLQRIKYISFELNWIIKTRILIVWLNRYTYEKIRVKPIHSLIELVYRKFTSFGYHVRQEETWIQLIFISLGLWIHLLCYVTVSLVKNHFTSKYCNHNKKD